MSKNKITIKILPTPAAQDISESKLLKLSRITKLSPERITERFAKGKGLTILTVDHPKVRDLISFVRSIGFSVHTEAADDEDGDPGPSPVLPSVVVRRTREDEWKVGEIIENLYEVRDIRQGGMGSVYIVHHRRWNTMMAVKSLLRHLRESEEERSLFVKEAETWIDIGFHPNVASCYYVRNVNDSPRIFVEYVDGGSVLEWLAHKRRVGWDVVLDLMVQVGDGLDHAHSKGLVHRDVKPANCMITKDGIIKVTDFGLTKRQSGWQLTEGVGGLGVQEPMWDREDITAAGMGTPGYMAPEMWIPHSQVGPQADIYAFGVMFFEICCGRKPFVLKPGEKRDKLAVAHVRKLPPSPSAVRPGIPPAIEHVILKCLEKNPEQRYSSFLSMREELEAVYEEIFAKKFPRERPDEVRLLADALNNRAVSLMDLNHQEEAVAALEKALELDPHHPEGVYNLGLLAWTKTGNPDRELIVKMEEVTKTPQYAGRGANLLGRCLLAIGDAPAALKAGEMSLAAEDASEEWLKSYAVALIGMGQDADAIGHLETYLLEFPDDDEAAAWLVGAMVRTGLADQARSRVEALPKGSEIRTMKVEEVAESFVYSGLTESRVFQGHGGWVTCIGLFPRSRLIATGSRDRSIKIWDEATGSEVRAFSLVGEPPGSLWISPDERLVAIGAFNVVAPMKILDMDTGRFAGNLPLQERVTAAGFSPDGKHFFTVMEKGAVRSWDTSDFKAEAAFKVPAHSAAALCFDGNGEPDLFLAGLDRVVKRMRPGASEPQLFEKGHRETIACITASPDGRRVLTCGKDRVVILWDGESGSVLITSTIHQDQIGGVALNPVSDLAASWDARIGIKVWDAGTGAVFRTFPQTDNEVLCLSFTLDGKRLLAGGRDMTLRIWDVRGRPLMPPLALARVRPFKKQMKSERKFKVMVESAAKAMRNGAYAKAYAMLEDSRLVAGYERSDVVLDLIMKMQAHGTRVGLRGGWNRRTFDAQSGVMEVRFSASAINLLTAQADHTARLWSTKTGDCVRILRGHTNLVASARYSANSREAATGGDDRTVRTWDLNTGKSILLLKGHTDSVGSVAYSPDGTALLSGSWDSTMKLWRLPDGGLLKTLKGHDDRITAVEFVGRSSMAASASFDGLVKIWDLSSGKLLRDLKGHKDKVLSLAVTRNGDLILSGSQDGTARLWDSKTGSCLRVFEAGSAGVRAVAFSPDEGFLVTGGNDAILKVWKVGTGACLREFQGHAREITSAEFASNGRFVASASADGTAMLWELDWDWRFDDKSPGRKPEA